MMVVTRIPPSPTGHLHIGTARTALFNYLFARHAGGTVIYRSEDTDRTRSTPAYENEIVEGLHWLSIDWDGFSRQSEHAPRHRALLEQLVGAGKAYVSKEPAKDNPDQTVELVRLRNPGTTITFTDLVRGDITFDTAELGDFVIARSLDEPLYHFAVVVDDMDAGVTHVIRGEDHISNTPRQILIQEALDAPRPAYAHLPLILDEKRAKLSKRSASGVPLVSDMRAEGVLPEAIVNYLALLGWNPGDDREYFSLAALVETFTLDGVQKSGAAWSREKLLSVNQHWMRALPDEAFLAHLGNLDIGCPSSETWTSDVQVSAVPLLKERACTFGEARELLRGELACLFSEPELDRAVLTAKEPADRPGMTRTALKSLLEPLKRLPEGVSAEAAKDTLMPLADAAEAAGKGGRGATLWPLRYALSGRERSPDPFTLVALLGPAAATERLKHALGILEE